MGSNTRDKRVKVVVRLRPFLKGERTKLQDDLVTIKAAENKVIVQENGKGKLICSFDEVFDKTASQQDVFQGMVHENVDAVLSGFNSTIFAYGQTGTGKTYTMLGDELEKSILKVRPPKDPISDSVEENESLEENYDLISENWGVIPRAINSLFQQIDSIKKGDFNSTVHCSYLQIYNDKLFDLLQDRRLQFPLKIRETKKGKRYDTYVQGLSEIRVSNLKDVLRVLKKGGYHRVVRATDYNSISSRSHAILTLTVTTEEQPKGTSSKIIRTSKLNMVDLAGSEKWDITSSIGNEQQIELRNINNSLSTLGNVIQALGEKGRKHIPYRDSKLTRLLQDSLGGNTVTTVICTISPCENSIGETTSTLQFADRAKRVMTRAKVNEVVDDSILLARAQVEISRLRRLLRKEKAESNKGNKELEKELEILRKANVELKELVVNLRKEIRDSKMKSQTVKRPKTPKKTPRNDEILPASNWRLSLEEIEVPKQTLNEVSSPAAIDILESLQFQLGDEDDLSCWDERTEIAMNNAEAGYLVQVETEKQRLDAIIKEKEQCELLLHEHLMRLQQSSLDNAELDDSDEIPDEIPATEASNLSEIVNTERKSKEERIETIDEEKISSNSKELSFSMADVGVKLRLYQCRLDAWFNIFVIDYDPASGMHRVQYENDSTLRWHQMEGRKYEKMDETFSPTAKTFRGKVKRSNYRKNQKRARAPSVLPTLNIHGGLEALYGIGNGKLSNVASNQICEPLDGEETNILSNLKREGLSYLD